VANWLGNSITVYAPSQKGNATPIRTITGSETKLANPTGVAFDSSGYLYVANSDPSAVIVFAPGADGDVLPVRSLTAYLYSPLGLALDTAGKAYVSNGDADDPPFVTVEEAGSKRKLPSRMIEGKKTMQQIPFGISVR
jgi:DNA-binding beta-propeller fold protein YncE